MRFQFSKQNLAENLEALAVKKNLVDLVKSFHTSSYLQKSVSIQPRTSLSKLQIRWQGKMQNG